MTRFDDSPSEPSMVRDLAPNERLADSLEPASVLWDRFVRSGPEQIATEELLAAFLERGHLTESSRAVAARMMNEYGGLAGIARCPIELLCRSEGIDLRMAIEVRLALELGKRMVALNDVRRPVNSPADVFHLLQADLRLEPQEHFKVLMLDSKNQVLLAPTITVGTVNASLIHPREVFRPALALPCVSVILAHNHPSGDPTPSREDLEVTRQLVAAGKVVGIEVLDHVILGEGRFVSLKERNLM